MKTTKTKTPARPRSKSNEIVSINPSTGEALGRVASVGRRGVKEAVGRAREAFESWSRLSIRDRQGYLRRLADVILSEKREIAELIALEQGKPMTEALGVEVLPVLAVVKDLSRNAHKTLKDELSRHQLVFFAHKRSHYRYEPYGVVAIISPWNFPFSVPLPQIAAAVVAGNTVLFKPACGAVLLGQKIHDLFRRAGFPEGVVNTIFVKEKDASVIAPHPDVKKVVFTGSTGVGRKIMAAAAQGPKPVVLELGGKDPAIVAADADLERAAKGIVWGAMFGSGQVCVSIERAYVERPAADALIEACVEEVAKLRVGDPLDENTEVGPLSNRQQLRAVTAHVKDAVEKGARILVGGKRKGTKGYFYEPTVLSRVDHSMAVMVEETFGPVLPIMVVDSVDEAIHLANDSIYGISAYGWTQDRATADRLMKELEAGSVIINDCGFSWGEPAAPWGGVKSSGVGRTRTIFGLQEMVQLKYTSFDQGDGKENAWWFPYDHEVRGLLAQGMDLFFKNDLREKVVPLLALLGNRRFLRSARWPSILSNLDKLL